MTCITVTVSLFPLHCSTWLPKLYETYISITLLPRKTLLWYWTWLAWGSRNWKLISLLSFLLYKTCDRCCFMPWSLLIHQTLVYLRPCLPQLITSVVWDLGRRWSYEIFIATTLYKPLITIALCVSKLWDLDHLCFFICSTFYKILPIT